MTAPLFEKFKKESQSAYAADLARVEDVPLEPALTFAAEQFGKLVPRGLETPDQFFFSVLETATKRSIGYLWLGFQQRFGRRIASINDISIVEEFRGKGFGKMLMSLAEDEARRKGAVRLRLHVFHGNEVARKLYSSMEFEATSVDMRKELE